MLSQAPILTLVLSFFLTALVSAQVSHVLSTQALPANHPLKPSVEVLAGKILAPDGQPASGIRVALNNADTPKPVTSTYTQPDGTFELYNIPQGN